MKQIGLLSDTHGYLHPKVFEFFADCDEVWHAGDIGGNNIDEELNKFNFLSGITFNICECPHINNLGGFIFKLSLINLSYLPG